MYAHITIQTCPPLEVCIANKFKCVFPVLPGSRAAPAHSQVQRGCLEKIMTIYIYRNQENVACQHAHTHLERAGGMHIYLEM